MQLQIPCTSCRGTGRQGDARDAERETCPTCRGEGALVRCSCGAVVAITDAGSNGFCTRCPETVARRAAEAKLRAEGWDRLGEVLGKAQKLIPGLRIELLP